MYGLFGDVQFFFSLVNMKRSIQALTMPRREESFISNIIDVWLLTMTVVKEASVKSRPNKGDKLNKSVYFIQTSTICHIPKSIAQAHLGKITYWGKITWMFQYHYVLTHIGLRLTFDFYIFKKYGFLFKIIGEHKTHRSMS